MMQAQKQVRELLADSYTQANRLGAGQRNAGSQTKMFNMAST